MRGRRLRRGAGFAGVCAPASRASAATVCSLRLASCASLRSLTSRAMTSAPLAPLASPIFAPVRASTATATGALPAGHSARKFAASVPPSVSLSATHP